MPLLISFLVTFLCVLIYVSIRIYVKLSAGWCESQVCLVGKTALVTGANTGIGYETALDLAKRGARVILACRDLKKAEDACNRIIQATRNRNVVVGVINMESFKSVREFAKTIIATENRLDILVNNAGAIILGDRKSEDGPDITLQVNHFSNFLLTNLLLDLLKKSTPSRIVNVSSKAAQKSTLNLDNIDKFVSNFHNYALSKLCNILFTTELAKKLETTGVTAYALHPGLVKTEIARHSQGLIRIPIDIIFNIFAKTSAEGAQTTIHCAVSNGIEVYNGGLFQDCKKISLYKRADNPSDAKWLWNYSEKVVGFKFEKS